MTRGAENWLYVYVYNNYKVFEFNGDTLLNWYIIALVVDFVYYWVHRACHEIHILWAQHQVHHSSEDYNLTVGFRHPLLHAWCGFIFYLPMAFFVSPIQFIMHQQFNLLYQFWIHSSVINNLGPLEYVLNTPNHHKVHHGCNKIYLDKNYGGVLIIWDRLFGTFEKYSPKHEIIFGIVSQPRTFNPLYQQIFYNNNVYEKFKKLNGWSNKIQSLFKGPSWLPGRSWTGCDADKTDIRDRKIYDPEMSIWYKVYLLIDFVLCCCFFQYAVTLSEVSPFQVLGHLFYVMFSLTIIGLFFDNHPWAIHFEILRCCINQFFIPYAGTENNIAFLIWSIHTLLFVFCLLKFFNNIQSIKFK
ncbi:hypothetical protein PGB90_009907 [Kerria lacca]